MDTSKYLDLFVSEAREHLEACEACIERLERDPSTSDSRRDLFRRFHSIKGMAATMGYPDLVELSHALEDALEGAARSDSGDLDTPLLWEGLACAMRCVSAAERGGDAADGQARPLARRIRDLHADAPRRRSGRPRPDGLETPRAAHGPEPPTIPDPVWTVRTPPRVASSAVVEMLRSIATLGEVVDARVRSTSAAERHVGSVVSVRLRHPGPADRLRRELEAADGLPSGVEVEAHPEPTALREPDGDAAAPLVRVRADLLDRLLEESIELLVAHEAHAARTRDPGLERCRALAHDLYGTLVEVRLVPFGTIAPRLERAVDVAARRLGKRVTFSIHGRDVRLDRSTLDALVEPLGHALRNAVDHGIEPVDARIESGKAGIGRITVSVERRHGRVVVEVLDDGRGVDPDAIRARAVEAGHLGPAAASALSDAEAVELVTLPGFTTRDRSDTISGRGVGLDALRDTVERLSGRLRILPRDGGGTRVVVELPPSSGVVEALIVRCGRIPYAIPVDAIELTRPASGGDDAVDLVAWLARTGDDPAALAEPRRWSAGTSRAEIALRPAPSPVVAVDEIVGRREILVRPLAAPLDGLRGFGGSTVLSDGSIALVVDPFDR